MSDDDIPVPGGLTTEGLLGRRYLARFIDSLIILVLIVVAAIPLGAVLAVKDSAGWGSVLALLPLILVIWIGYGTLLEWSKWQATIGKRLVGLRVYDSQGGRLTLMQAGGRNMLKDGSFLAFAAIPGGQLLSIVWLCAHPVVIHRSGESGDS